MGLAVGAEVSLGVEYWFSRGLLLKLTGAYAVVPTDTVHQRFEQMLSHGVAR